MTTPNPLDNPAFQRLREVLSDIPAINAGGCGVAAYAMYKWLQANGYPEAQIVYGYDFEDDYNADRNRSFLAGGAVEASSCTHAFIQIEKLNLTFDCEADVDELLPEHLNEAMDMTLFEVIPHQSVENFMLSSLSSQSAWCHMFHRNNIPVLYFALKSLGLEAKVLADVAEYDTSYYF